MTIPVPPAVLPVLLVVLLLAIAGLGLLGAAALRGGGR